MATPSASRNSLADPGSGLSVVPSAPPPDDAPTSSADGASPDQGRLERHLGNVIRQLRHQQRLTIADVAAQAQISRGMLSKIENGQASTSLDTLGKLASVLGPSAR